MAAATKEAILTAPWRYHVVLVEPEIPQNTGAIARMCVATRSVLHLVGRLGFHLDERSLRRAGLDYWEHVRLVRHDDWSSFRSSIDLPIYLFSARAGETLGQSSFPRSACLVFGNESRGLPNGIKNENFPAYRIPIYDDRVRSLNLATAVGIVLYEAIRQNSQ